MKYLPLLIGLGVLAYLCFPYFRENEEPEEITSGEASIAAVDMAAKRMN